MRNLSIAACLLAISCSGGNVKWQGDGAQIFCEQNDKVLSNIFQLALIEQVGATPIVSAETYEDAKPIPFSVRLYEMEKGKGIQHFRPKHLIAEHEGTAEYYGDVVNFTAITDADDPPQKPATFQLKLGELGMYHSKGRLRNVFKCDWRENMPTLIE